MTKEEKIQQAYGELYNKIYTDKDGWISYWNYSHYKIKDCELKVCDGTTLYRLKSLKGIENNNGWIKIERESDFPKESGQYWILEDGEIYMVFVIDKYGKIIYSSSIDKVTHYQPIQKPREPLY